MNLISSKDRGAVSRLLILHFTYFPSKISRLRDLKIKRPNKMIIERKLTSAPGDFSCCLNYAEDLSTSTTANKNMTLTE